MKTKTMSMVEGLRDAIRVAMRSDPTVFVIGEDIGIAGGFGGGFTVTLGLSDEFGHDRIMDTPISEIAIVGTAVGAAMTGMRPIAEMQYGDFIFCAMDQIVNQAAKMRYMSNGQVAVPMVLRLPVGASSRRAQHGQCTEAFFMHTPGLKVVCPSTAYDAKGLMLAAIRDGNPVVFLEHKLLYGAKGGRKEKTSLDLSMEVPEGDYEVALGSVAVRREGTAVTILANMLMVHRAVSSRRTIGRRRHQRRSDRHPLPRSLGYENHRAIGGENEPRADCRRRHVDGRMGRGIGCEIERGRVLRPRCARDEAGRARHAVAMCIHARTRVRAERRAGGRVRTADCQGIVIGWLRILGYTARGPVQYQPEARARRVTRSLACASG